MARPRKQPAGAQPSLLTADAAPLPELPVAEQPYPLPTGWKWVRLGDLYQINPKITAQDETLVSFVPMEKISAGMTGSFTFEVRPWGKVKKGYTQFANGDVAFAKISPCFENGKSMLVQGLKNGIGAGTTELVIIRQPTISQKYTFYIISNDDFIRRGVQTYSGTVGQQRVSMDFVRNYPIPLPPREEQERIVARIESLFSQLDEAREKVDAVVEGSETRRAALLHKAFSGELTAKWREEKGVDINGWKRVQLGDVYQINPKVAAHDDTPVSFVPMEKISSGMTGNFTFEIMPWGKAKKGHTRFADGDVAFAKISPCFENGKSMLVHGLENGIGAGTTELIVLRQPNILQKYTFYLISSTDFIQKGIQTYSGTVGQQRISMDFVRAYPIPLPTLPEQEEIVRLLDSLLERERQIREAAEQVRERIDLMKKAILARAFRGELG